MFDKFRQAGDLLKMRSEAKRLQGELEQVTQSLDKNSTSVVVNANQKVLRLVIEGVERKDVAEVINDAFKEVQKKAAKKMLEAGGGLSGLLGKF